VRQRGHSTYSHGTARKAAAISRGAALARRAREQLQGGHAKGAVYLLAPTHARLLRSTGIAPPAAPHHPQIAQARSIFLISGFLHWLSTLPPHGEVWGAERGGGGRGGGGGGLEAGQQERVGGGRRDGGDARCDDDRREKNGPATEKLQKT
jgi:hypothetical protein